MQKNKKTLINFTTCKVRCWDGFWKTILRTRLSFNVGMKKLGGQVIELNSEDIGFDNKRETEEDVLNVLSQYIDCIMIRNDDHKKILKLASQNVIPVINGLTNYSHPCQILGDFLTIQEKFKTLKNCKITWIGDYNNVLVSLLHLQNIYFFNLNIVIPSKILKLNQKKINQYANKNLKLFTDPILGSTNSNCIIFVLAINGWKKIKIKLNIKNFTVNKKIINNAAKNIIFMHCLPTKRGSEVTSEILDGKHSVV